MGIECKFKSIIVICLINLSLNINSQSLFEDAISEEAESSKITFDLGGDIKTGIITSAILDEIRENYSELRLEIDHANKGVGRGYCDIQLSTRNDSIPDIREAWIELYLGPLDLRMGQQIISWGRGDGINPTDNFSRKNLSTYQINEDYYRLPNIGYRMRLYLNNIVFESVLIPEYRYSEINMPVTNENISSLQYGVKASVEASVFEGSLSWFHGRVPEGGLKSSSVRYASEQKVVGGDFALTIDRYVVRGEGAYSITHNYTDELYIPFPEWEWVIGIDTELYQSLTIGVQYFGKYVENWSELSSPDTDIYLKKINRAIWSQSEEFQNGYSCRLGIDILHETILFDILASYNLSTEELLHRFKTSWKIADGINFYTGFNYVNGAKETRADMVEDVMQIVFAEIMFSF